MSKNSKKLVIANWKMGPSGFNEAKSLFYAAKKATDKAKDVDVVLCPPFLWLSLFLHKRVSPKISFGSQNVFWQDKGAFTGEVSARMLKGLGVKYVIVGHSERRERFFETDEVVNKKILECLKYGLKPVLCAGEKERSDFSFYEFVKEEIKNALKRVPRNKINEVLVAYEPVWAIGSGKTVSEGDLLEMTIYIKKVLFDIFGKAGSSGVKILYGGSVDKKNARDFLKTEGIDGLLVGEKSLDKKEFPLIISSAVFQKERKLRIKKVR